MSNPLTPKGLQDVIASLDDLIIEAACKEISKEIKLENEAMDLAIYHGVLYDDVFELKSKSPPLTEEMLDEAIEKLRLRTPRQSIHYNPYGGSFTVFTSESYVKDHRGNSLPFPDEARLHRALTQHFPVSPTINSKFPPTLRMVVKSFIRNLFV